MDYDFLLQKLYEIKGVMGYDIDAMQAINTCIKIIESKPEHIMCKVSYDERFDHTTSIDFEEYMNHKLAHCVSEHIRAIMKPKTYTGIFDSYKYVDLWIGGLDTVEPKVYPPIRANEWMTPEEADLTGGWSNEKDI